jgi:hypothetical protein
VCVIPFENSYGDKQDGRNIHPQITNGRDKGKNEEKRMSHAGTKERKCGTYYCSGCEAENMKCTSRFFGWAAYKTSYIHVPG